ncbi:MAG: PE-PPE domain-containing protein, partial [Mycobacterium sp.]
MRRVPRPYSTVAVVIAGASLIAVPPVTSPGPAIQARAVQLTGTDTADSPLGDGTALVLGPSGFPIP